LSAQELILIYSKKRNKPNIYSHAKLGHYPKFRVDQVSNHNRQKSVFLAPKTNICIKKYKKPNFSPNQDNFPAF